jgi:hypothetical protein
VHATIEAATSTPKLAVIADPISAATGIQESRIALAGKGRPTRHLERRYGDLGREIVRRRAVSDALTLLEHAAGY